MENKDISQMALQKIKENGIKPISKNIFNFKRIFFWSLVSFLIIVGILAFAIVLSILFTHDWYLYNKLGFAFIFKSLPYFWFGLLIIFILLGDFYYKKTPLGYRHRDIMIVGLFVVLTMIFGFILYFIGIGEKAEDSLSRNVPIYRGFMFDRNEFWSHPEQGFIFGRIILIDGDLIKIIDHKNNIWAVEMSNAFVGQKVKIQEGEIIKIIGNLDENIFKAEQIRPGTGNKFNQNKKINSTMR